MDWVDFVHTRHPLGISVNKPTSAITSDHNREHLTAQMKRIALRRIWNRLVFANRKLTQPHAQYKRSSNKTVSTLAEFAKRQEIFLDRTLQFSATALENDDGHRKLLAKTTGPFRVISPNQDTVTINQDGLRDTVSIGRFIAAPSEEDLLVALQRSP